MEPDLTHFRWSPRQEAKFWALWKEQMETRDTALYQTSFALRDLVHIDGDTSLTACVTAVCWREEAPSIEVSWMHNGNANKAWIEPWRLSMAKTPDPFGAPI